MTYSKLWNLITFSRSATWSRPVKRSKHHGTPRIRDWPILDRSWCQEYKTASVKMEYSETLLTFWATMHWIVIPWRSGSQTGESIWRGVKPLSTKIFFAHGFYLFLCVWSEFNIWIFSHQQLLPSLPSNYQLGFLAFWLLFLISWYDDKGCVNFFCYHNGACPNMFMNQCPNDFQISYFAADWQITTKSFL